MDFRPDEAQQAIISLAGEILDANPGAPEKAWADLDRAGLLTLAVPTRLGGAGLGVLETALLLTEIGRRGLDVPALPALALGVLPVARWGTPQQQDELLTDGRTLTAAIAEPGDPLPAAPRTIADADQLITGIKTGVTAADHILVTVSGPAVMVVDATAPGVRLDGRILRLDQAQGRRLGGRQCHEDLHRYALAGACALGDGALAGALALTAEHVRTRHQFGRPLATFQAVAQQIADVYIASRTLHLAALAAAWHLDAAEKAGAGKAGTEKTGAGEGAAGRVGAEEGGAGRRAAGRAAVGEARSLDDLADDDLHIAAQWLTAEAPPAVRTCHHLHGGLGLAIDYPLHRQTTLIRDMVRFLGGSEYRLQTLGERGVHRPE